MPEAGTALAPMTPGCCFGFDFGRRRIGLALGEFLTGTTRGLATLPARAGVPDWNRLDQLLREWQPGALVVGLPLLADGGEGDLATAARRFGRRLAARYRLPVHFVDERLSSHAAEARLRARGRRYQAGHIDREAARIILETWLQEAAARP